MVVPPLFLILLFVVSLSPATAATEPCAASRADVSGYSGAVEIPTFATTYDTTLTDTFSARVTFDRALGRSTLSAASAGLFDARLRVVECLDVVGAAAGTPIDATLEFDVAGWSLQSCGGSGCGVLLEATVAVGADSASANANQGGPGNGAIVPLDATLAVPIRFVTGTPVTVQFVLQYATGPGAGGSQGEVVGTWRVAGLPQGVRAVGSVGSDLTPARVATWGRLKTLYR